MKFSRQWAMPSHNTFSIKPISELILRVVESEGNHKNREHNGTTYSRGLWLDPFSRNSPFLGTIRNDLSTEFEADYHEEALVFLERFKGAEADGVLFDPPYSPRQISECYKQVGRKVHTEDTQSSFYGDRKKAAAATLKIGGIAICFGWNSGGFGKTLGFELEEVMLVAHGGAHNDTIVTIERKIK